MISLLFGGHECVHTISFIPTSIHSIHIAPVPGRLRRLPDGRPTPAVSSQECAPLWYGRWVHCSLPPTPPHTPHARGSKVRNSSSASPTSPTSSGSIGAGSCGSSLTSSNASSYAAVDNSNRSSCPLELYYASSYAAVDTSNRSSCPLELYSLHCGVAERTRAPRACVTVVTAATFADTLGMGMLSSRRSRMAVVTHGAISRSGAQSSDALAHTRTRNLSHVFVTAR